MASPADLASPSCSKHTSSRKRKVQAVPDVPPGTLASLESRLTSLETKLTAIRKQLKTHGTEVAIEPEKDAVVRAQAVSSDASKEALLHPFKKEIVDDLHRRMEEVQGESSIEILETEVVEEMDLDDERALDEVENCIEFLESTVENQSSETLQKQETDNLTPILPPTPDLRPNSQGNKMNFSEGVADLKPAVSESCSFQSSEALEKQETKAETDKSDVLTPEEQPNFEDHAKMSSPIRDCNMKSIAKGVADLEAAVSDSTVQKCILHEFVKISHPVLKDVPDWISGPYQEFKDDSIRLCSNCQSLCEWIYFLTSSRKELCASCITAEGYNDPVKIFLREGVAEYLTSLDNAASTLVCPKQVPAKKNKLSSKNKKALGETILRRRVRRVISCEFVREESSSTSLQSFIQAYRRRHKCSISPEKLTSVLTILGFKCEILGGSPVVRGLKLCNAGTQ